MRQLGIKGLTLTEAWERDRAIKHTRAPDAGRLVRFYASSAKEGSIMWKLFLTLGSALESAAADPSKRRAAESALELALDETQKIAGADSLVGKACAAGLKVLHEGEALAGDPGTGGSSSDPLDVLK